MAFEGAGKAAGLQIWRIEDFSPVPISKETYGKFHTGDSYILLNTRKLGGSYSWDVHFWLGAETSTDESGAAAMLSVELDDQLGGSPTQHREVQENESSLFLSYFPKGVRYLAGGVKSGFTHYDPDQVEKRMFMVKGKKYVQVKEVPLSVSSMNRSDCFVLDCGKGKSILIYTPPAARKMEKFRAIQVANEIRDEDHAGHAHVEVLDEFSPDLGKFFLELGSGSPDEVPLESADDETAEKEARRVTQLYRVRDNTVEQVASPPLTQDMLDNKDAFILDGGAAGVFVWVGKGATTEEKKKAMSSAEKLLQEGGHAKTTKVVRVTEGLEGAAFKQFFAVWNEVDPAKFQTAVAKSGVAEWSVSDLHLEALKRIDRAGGAAPGFMPDDGTGAKTIWRIENMDLAQVDTGNFLFGGDSYVILYKYGDGKTIVYFWQGNKSSLDEKAASAIQAARIDNEELGGSAVQVRVVQGQEPRHFIKMFGGSLVVFAGGKASGFKNVDDRDEYDTDGVRLFRVRGAGEGQTDFRAEQVEEVSASLASDDVFILETTKQTWLWKGKESSAEELTEAQRLAKILSPKNEPQVIGEGEEPDEFWSVLGGKGAYSSGHGLDRPLLEPRLFHVRRLPSGSIRAIEIQDFQQSDLVDDDVMLLDTGREIIVWVGSGATREEKDIGMDLAKKYLDADPTTRNVNNTVIMVVKQGDEPANFTAAFPEWQK